MKASGGVEEVEEGEGESEMREDRVLFVFALVKYTNIGGTESVIKIMLEEHFVQKCAKSTTVIVM